MRGGFEAAALIAPDAADALPRLQSDAGVQAAITSAALLTAAHPELSRNRGGALREVFIARDAGMRMLHDLLLAQPADRARLLEAAPLSRAQLARRHGVSRTHVNRLLAEAQAAGAIRLPAPNRIAFTPAFSDEVEAYYAGLLQVMRVVAATLVATPGLSAA
jgi:hypothetical protein